MDTFIVFFLSYFIEAIIFWAYSDTFFPAKFSPPNPCRFPKRFICHPSGLFFSETNRIKFNFIHSDQLPSSISPP